MYNIIRRPTLLIFDIDETLIRNSFGKNQRMITNDHQLRQAMYDPTLLTQPLVDPNFQIAIASFNTFSGSPYTGPSLARKILDMQYPHDAYGDSTQVVEDAFIQAWMPSPENVFLHGKNVHIHNILQAYMAKYHTAPSEIIFYDDCIENVYLAAQIGVNSLWVTDGLTKHTSNLLHIDKRIGFLSDKLIHVTLFGSYIKLVSAQNGMFRYIMYIGSNLNMSEALRQLKEISNRYHLQIQLNEKIL